MTAADKLQHGHQDPEDRALAAVIRASASLLKKPELQSVLPKILETAQDLLSVDAYAVWRQSPGPIWEILHSEGLSEQYKRDAAITGSTANRWLSEPMVSEDVQHHPQVEGRGELYKREGICSIIALPLRTEANEIGTLALYFRQPRKVSPSDVEIATALANISAAAINAAELYEQQLRLRCTAEAEERRAKFLSEASAALASSLDYTATLNRIASLAVPVIADWCSVRVFEPDGSFGRVAVAHSDSAKLAVADELQRLYPPDLTKDKALARILETGEPVFVPAVTDEMLIEAARDDRHLALMRRLAIRSVLTVPIKSLSKVTGTISFIMAESSRELESEDLRLAQDLAARAAIAIENARLYSQLQDQLTTTKMAEEKIRLADERLRFAHSVGRIATWELDTTEDSVRLSPEAGALILWQGPLTASAESLLNHLHVSGDRERLARALDRTIRSRKELTVEFRIANGTEVNVISARGKLFYNAGRPILIGVFVDVTPKTKSKTTGRTASVAD
jgi:GAF domain-containing protein